MRIGGFQKVSFIDYPGEVCSIIFTQGCNFRCPYCHNPELVLPEYFVESLSEQEILTILDERKNKVPAVVITGGEPTLQLDLLDFMRQVKKIGLKIKLDTNGSNPGILRQIIEEKLVDYIAMDIKAPLTKYNQIVNKNVNIKKIQDSIILIMNSVIDYEFRTTIVKEMLNIENFEQIGQEINGAKLYILQKFKETKILANKKFTCFPDKFLNNIQKNILKYVKKCEIR